MATITGSGLGTTSEKAMSAKAISARTQATRTRRSIFAAIAAFFSSKFGMVMVCLRPLARQLVHWDEDAEDYGNWQPRKRLDLA